MPNILYVTEDGQKFTDLEDAKAHEASLSHTMRLRDYVRTVAGVSGGDGEPNDPWPFFSKLLSVPGAAERLMQLLRPLA
jgi:hypothetical protein